MQRCVPGAEFLEHGDDFSEAFDTRARWRNASARCTSLPTAWRYALRIRGPFEIIRQHVTRLVTVKEAELTAAMRCLFTDTHNVAEGVRNGARSRSSLSGGNVDAELFTKALTD